MNLLTDINILDKTRASMKEFIDESVVLKHTQPEFVDDIDNELLDLCKILFLNSVIELYPGADIEAASVLAQEIDKKYLELMYDR